MAPWSSSSTGPRIDDPPLYEWQLTSSKESYTRYDYPRATPDADTLGLQFTILATVNAVVAMAVLVLILAMLRSRKVLSNPFSLYLLFIAVPDFVVSFCCFWTCVLSAPLQQYVSEWMCGFQAFYLCWAFCANSWLNGVIVYHIHKLLVDSQQRRHHTPPTRTQVIRHSLAVYLYSSVWGWINATNRGWLPHEAHLYRGFACFGMERDLASAIFYWFLFMPAFMGVPLVYAGYVLSDIWRRKLLPPLGLRRALSLFLLRLVCLYFAIWFPFLVLFMIGNFVYVGSWYHFVGSVISHLQGIISVTFCLTNPDIRKAVVILLTCRPANSEGNGDNAETSKAIRQEIEQQRKADSHKTSEDDTSSSSFPLAAAATDGATAAARDPLAPEDARLGDIAEEHSASEYEEDEK
jgi:hypothetical protein